MDPILLLYIYSALVLLHRKNDIKSYFWKCFCILWCSLFSHTHTHTHTHTTHTHTHTTHTHTTHTHRLVLMVNGTLHRLNGFYTVQIVFSITLHLNLPLTGNFLHFYFLKKTNSVWFIRPLNYGDTEIVPIVQCITLTNAGNPFRV